MRDIRDIVEEVTQEVAAEYPGYPCGEDIEGYSPRGLARYIDHTLLKADATEADVRKLCREARDHGFASVCINPSYVRLAADCLDGTRVNVCTVVAFPLGATATQSKVAEAVVAVENGANEIDMVMDIGAAKSGNWRKVKRDIEEVVDAVGDDAIVKVIIETCLLNDEEKVKASAVAKLAGAHFVKTSTGFSTGGAKTEDVRIIRQTVGPKLGVKASGGIKNYDDAVEMIKAGASRIGTSSGVAIVTSELRD